MNGTVGQSNIAEIDESMKCHSHEEADTLIVLHALDVSRRYADCELHVVSPDTDIFILLVNRYESLSSETHFVTGRGNEKTDMCI